MSEVHVWRQFNAMKKRQGGWAMSPIEKLRSERTHVCPGWMGDPNPRRKLVFDRRQGHSETAYRLYWRLHPQYIPDFKRSKQ